MSNTILSVVGARPNFMKIAPILRAMHATPGLSPYLVHTGQHYDVRLSEQFFIDLELPEPDMNLEVGSASHGVQTGEMMKRLEPLMEKVRPALVLVVGDVNSTLAAALVAAKLHIPIAHVEAGLRSFDRRMPEEVNRVVTDALSSLLFVTEPAGMAHLAREGIPSDRTFLVGDVMIDSVARALPIALERAAPTRASLGVTEYAICTLHRPSNVDDFTQLESVVTQLELASSNISILFPVHPRTEQRLKSGNLYDRLSSSPNLKVLPPLGYLEFLGLLAHAKFALTDSGGIQAEAAYLRVPCLTLRDTTERPETVEIGLNRLLGSDARAIAPAVMRLLADSSPIPRPTTLMDGHAAERIVTILQNWLRTQGCTS